ncbi:MAG TPA: S-adenosylmethionine decarboxylase [Methanomassiliicoccales archaeon]|nr:S-adenosylmethionine decarboxylase [Methanomassiliicoccales archaeon]HOO04280.1 S-adenosylmethionine decarboxylase [Methanomassiliicoccales archaeon]HQM67263.1 S-adenosylmethionine decarboxylase [Methanomassiliicoccales archaeon]HRR66820.1 S-adenosylmethionine decarboxylase [Methanomassiliicoccales archaeon]
MKYTERALPQMYTMSPRAGKLLNDEEAMEKYVKEDQWGMATAVDLSHCDPEKIRSKEVITQFAIDLCEYIKMKRFGDPIVVRFGPTPKVEGYSLAQLIETSMISGHFAEDTNRAFIDIFSCREYPPKKTAEFCKRYFGAKEMEYSVTFRN